VVESVEGLGQTKRMFGEHRELERSHDLLDDLVQPGGLEHETPELVAFLAFQCARVRCRHAGANRVFVKAEAIAQLGKDVVRAHHGILQVRPALAFETERLGDIERDDLAARVLDHEVADRRDGNLSADNADVVGAELRIALGDLGRCGSLEQIDQIVGLDPEPFPPRHFHERLLRILSRGLVPEVTRGLMRQRHHLVRKMDRALGFRLMAHGGQRLRQ
jgi:hypothetical protein